MHKAKLDDGREVIVDTSSSPSRSVGGQEHFLTPGYVNVFLDGGWQTVRESRVKKMPYGHPLAELKK